VDSGDVDGHCGTVDWGGPGADGEGETTKTTSPTPPHASPSGPTSNTAPASTASVPTPVHHQHHHSHHLHEHESPTRAATARTKDKRCRPNHLHKAKPAKDKRKLREKRRSTGVVHMPSTESTGDSLDEDDIKCPETRRNTTLNEGVTADGPSSPSHDNGYTHSRHSRNKSPSDLEADFEDNQDYDSTVSQSETNLTTIGQSSPQPAAFTARFRVRNDNRSAATSHKEDFASRPVSYPSRFRDPEFENAGLVSHNGSQLLSSKTYTSNKDVETSFTEQVPRSVGLRDQRRERASRQENSEAVLLARIRELEMHVEKEKQEKQRLREMVDDRDVRICQLEKEVSLLQQVGKPHIIADRVQVSVDLYTRYSEYEIII